MKVIPKPTKLYNPNSTFVSPIYTFTSAGNIIVYTPIQGTTREKYFNHIIYKEKMPSLAGKNILHFFLHRPRLFHLSTDKVRVQSLKNGHQSGYSRADTINNNKQKIKQVFHKKKLRKINRK